MDLDFDDGEFDVVVCFEVIEHVDEGARALAELKRVLKPDGLLVVSSPNPASYVPGNPYHVHEYGPDELCEALSGLFENVRVWRQQGWIGAGILDDETTELSAPLGGLNTIKLATTAPDTATYSIALAAEGSLPEPQPLLVLTGLVEVRRWLELYQSQHEALEGQHADIERLRATFSEVDDLRERLRAAESELARLPALEREAELAEVDRQELDAHRTRLEVLEADLEEERAQKGRAERAIEQMTGSVSWRITRPLRRLKRALS
jgi:SAM-dependent methyltransferase